MSEAETMLNSLSENDIALYTADTTTEGHIVVNTDRTITVPDGLKRIAIQFDHNMETVTFDCPRYWDGKDISAMTIYINYLRADNKSGSYVATNVKIDETDDSIFHFDWVVSRHASAVNGKLKFLVCTKKTDSDGNEINHWNSELNRDMYINEGLNSNDNIVDQYPDVIELLLSNAGYSDIDKDKKELNTRMDKLIKERG